MKPKKHGSQLPRKPLVDELEGLHAVAHHAVGRAEVVGTDTVLWLGCRLWGGGFFAGYPSQQGIDFIL
jgi:hypothetical protein